MLGKKRPCKVHQVGDNTVVGVRPERSEFKAITGLTVSGLRCCSILDSIKTGGVRVVFGIRAIGDNEYLNILEQAAACPKAISLIAVNLVECLLDGHTAPLQLDMDGRQTIDQHSHVIAVIIPCTIVPADHILVDDLQAVIVDMVLVQQPDILGTSIIPVKNLDMVLLKAAGLFYDSVRGGCDTVGKEPLPLSITKVVTVQFFQLVP